MLGHFTGFLLGFYILLHADEKIHLHGPSPSMLVFVLDIFSPWKTREIWEVLGSAASALVAVLTHSYVWKLNLDEYLYIIFKCTHACLCNFRLQDVGMVWQGNISQTICPQWYIPLKPWGLADAPSFFLCFSRLLSRSPSLLMINNALGFSAVSLALYWIFLYLGLILDLLLLPNEVIRNIKPEILQIL